MNQRIFALALIGALSASALQAREPEPSPSPTASPNPTASPTPNPSPSPSPSPSASPGDDNGGGRGGRGGDDRGDFSLRGSYEGTTSSGGIIVLYVERNSQIQVNLLDVAGQSIGSGEGVMANGAFSFTLSNGQLVSGTAAEHSIAGSVGSATFQATREREFGDDNGIAGRFLGVANGPGGESRVMIMINRDRHIVLLQTGGSGSTAFRAGGVGTINPPAAAGGAYTFTLTRTIGSTSQITGSFTIVNGVFQGAFTTSAGTFTVNSFNNSLAHRMAAISTRGLVGTNEGVLIGGFIISGGPKLVMVRAMGPSLTGYGVANALGNPSMKLYANSTLLKENDDWRSNANAADITASGLAPSNDLEAALLVRLEPGAYTTVVSGAPGSPVGVGLVEIYEVHD